MESLRTDQTTPMLASCVSELGGLAVAALAGHVVGVSFGNRHARDAISALSRRLAPRAIDEKRSIKKIDPEADLFLAEQTLEQLQQFAAGEQIDLRRIPVSLHHLTAFQRQVVKACRAIKRGECRTYGQVAALAGSPGAARAVGQVMRTNRTPLIVPCHRVVAAGGKIGGFSAPQGLAMKRRLLELESNSLFS